MRRGLCACASLAPGSAHPASRAECARGGAHPRCRAAPGAPGRIRFLVRRVALPLSPSASHQGGRIPLQALDAGAAAHGCGGGARVSLCACARRAHEWERPAFGSLQRKERAPASLSRPAAHSPLVFLLSPPPQTPRHDVPVRRARGRHHHPDRPGARVHPGRRAWHGESHRVGARAGSEEEGGNFLASRNENSRSLLALAVRRERARLAAAPRPTRHALGRHPPGVQAMLLSPMCPVSGRCNASNTPRLTLSLALSFLSALAVCPRRRLRRRPPPGLRPHRRRPGRRHGRPDRGRQQL